MVKRILTSALLSLFIVNAACADQVVRTLTRSVSVTPVITAGAYSAGDVVGGLMEFADAVSAPMKSGMIQTATISDEADQGAALKLLCFSGSVTVAADNAALSISDDDSRKMVASIAFASADYDDVGGAKVQVKAGINQAFTIPSDRSLYCQLFANASTPTYAATNDVTVTLVILQD